MSSKIEKLCHFVEKMKAFPCSFNLGSANLDVGGQVFNTNGLREPKLQKGIWSRLKSYLEEDVDQLDPDLVDPTWKDNLRARVYAELGDFERAKEVSSKVLESCPENLVGTANTAFLLAYELNFSMAENVLEKLEGIKKSENFDQLKLEAIVEQAYTHYKILNPHNIPDVQNAIKILEYCVKGINSDGKTTEKLELMLASLYKRNGNRDFNENNEEFITKAVNLLSSIKDSTTSDSVKAICYVKLARLNRNMDESVMDMCQQAVELKPNSTRVLTTAGPILVSVRDFYRAENLLREIIRNTNDPLNYAFLGGVYFSQAKKHKFDFPRCKNDTWRSAFNIKNNLVRQLLTIISNLPSYGDRNTYMRKAVDCFRVYTSSDACNASHCCKIAFKLFLAREYDDAFKVCQKIVSGDKSKVSACHVDAYYVMALCYALKCIHSSDVESLEEVEKKCLEMVVLSLRYAAVLMVEEAERYTVDYYLLWRGLRERPRGFILYHVMDFRLNNFHRLQKLVILFSSVLPDLERIIQKTEEDWNDVTQIEQELEQLKNTNLNLALLYLSLINLRPETRQRISWRNSHVVRAIKLEAAKDIFTQGKLGVCHDGIWQEIFHEEFQIDPKSKTTPVALLDRLIKGTSCDVFIVENIKTTNHRGNDVIMSQVLKDLITNICGLTVMTSADVLDADEIRQVISRSNVLIVLQKQKRKQSNRNETTLNPTPTRSDGNDSGVLRQSLEIFAASSKEGTTPRHAIIAVVEDENHEDELRIPKELSGHSQLTFTLEEVKVLEEMSSSREDGQVDVFMKLFKTIVRQC
ncbi:uncharacterized protein LOC131952085 [Physella acuta]|uniref:uncharacterized protein LOC131952085 n=1 Tax=Physella acuta TaxID=109671 RepID=UPI0027DD8251|nr:uncharacterized protein LOC131952085 [Physella acuta]